VRFSSLPPALFEIPLHRSLAADREPIAFMAQRISHLYSLVTIPKFYSGLQRLLGAPAARQRLVDELVRPRPGMKVLDVACGPGSLFPQLSETDYTGIDLNVQSIEHARELYGTQGRFVAGDVTKGLPGEAGSFDLVVVSALLHHLGDDEARKLFSSLQELLKPAGRIVTIDNVWLERQNSIARLFNHLDSGLNVRTPGQYEALVAHLPLQVESRLYRDLLRIPYDHFCMTLTSRPARAAE
jgi:SAM-dependent methyltransferase